jgi:hypothetical protein
MQPANDNHAFARELWEAVRQLEKEDRKKDETDKQDKNA